MEWNGMEWNGMEWNGMEWNGTDFGRRRGCNLCRVVVLTGQLGPTTVDHKRQPTVACRPLGVYGSSAAAATSTRLSRVWICAAADIENFSLEWNGMKQSWRTVREKSSRGEWRCGRDLELGLGNESGACGLTAAQSRTLL